MDRLLTAITNPRPIEIIREYHTYHFENSCVRDTEIKLTVFIPSEVVFFFYPFRTYLPELKIELGDGKPSPIFSYLDLHRILKRKPFTLDEIRKLAAEMYGISEEELKQFTNFAIVLFPAHPDHINEIILKWVEPQEVDRESDDKITQNALFTLYFPPTQNAGLYVALKVNDKYEIQKNPTVTKIEKINTDFHGYTGTFYKETSLELENHSILNDKKHNVVHFERHFSDRIKVQFKITVPKMVVYWLWFGLVLGMSVIPYALLMHNFQYIYPVVLGVIGLLIGLRILLFHDIELLNRWNWVYLGIIATDIVILGGLGLKNDAQLIWGNPTTLPKLS